MSSKVYDINELNIDTILLKTRKLKKLCDNGGNINSQHLNALIEILDYFFEKYNDCFLSSVVWEVVDKIIILENTIEDRKSIDVDLDISINFCEFLFSKLVCHTNYENDNLTYSFSFNCLRRHLCSVISSFLNFNNSTSRRKIETAFTNQLLNLTKQLFENIKIENDLELKISYTEFLWRAFRRVDLSTFNIKRFHVNIETLEKLKNFKILKFDEECINWLKEENFLDGKCIIENGSFIISGNKKYVKKECTLCYLGKSSMFLYYDNVEEDEKCKIEVPYYHITSAYFKNKDIFTLECKAIVEQTNIFCLWGEDVKNSIDHETINKFTLSIEVKKSSKEIKNIMNSLLDTLSLKLEKEEQKRQKCDIQTNAHNKQYKKKEDKVRLSYFSEDNIVERLQDSPLTSNSSFKDKDISEKLLRNNTRKRIETLKCKGSDKRETEKSRDCTLAQQREYMYTIEKKKKNLEKECKLKYNKLSEQKNYVKGYEDNGDFKKQPENEHFLMNYKLDISTPQVRIKGHNIIERDSDTEIIIEKIISCHKEKKEKFKMNLKKNFCDALNEIDNHIKSLIEKQKIRRDELHKKYEKKKKSIMFSTEKEISMLTKEMNVLIESMKKISVNKNDVKKVYEEGKFIFCTSEILNKSQGLVKKIKENLEKMNTDIIGKEKEYNKRKKLCFKALATAYE
ncbi:conserved Plasmodium protein, unknown function [Plasmodium malariae]|uniref:Uncharacterized protein n=1 Tax=Plasmodium malariae TaxID=5858 RepID=A0A1A8W9J9_PLAMA|nr:conserved Plasmodium protein, unknown function [Plasmodium malariae]